MVNYKRNQVKEPDDNETSVAQNREPTSLHVYTFENIQIYHWTQDKKVSFPRKFFIRIYLTKQKLWS